METIDFSNNTKKEGKRENRGKIRRWEKKRTSKKNRIGGRGNWVDSWGA